MREASLLSRYKQVVGRTEGGHPASLTIAQELMQPGYWDHRNYLRMSQGKERPLACSAEYATDFFRCDNRYTMSGLGGLD